jgi:hypothetical protein
VQPPSHRLFVHEKTRAAPIQLSLDRMVLLHFGENVPRMSSSVKYAKTRLDQYGHVFGAKRERASDMRFGDFSLMDEDQALFAADAANTDN